MLTFAQIVIRLTKKYGRLYRFLKRLYWLSHGIGEMSPFVFNCRNWTSSTLIRCLLKVIVSPLCIFDYFRYKNLPEREGLAFVLIAKNEAPYIEEWINFHIKQGVSHFFIYI